jgi:hypothetical protein
MSDRVRGARHGRQDAYYRRQKGKWDVNLVLVVVGFRPDTDLLLKAANRCPGCRDRRRVDGDRPAARLGGQRNRCARLAACFPSIARQRPSKGEPRGGPAKCRPAHRRRASGVHRSVLGSPYIARQVPWLVVPEITAARSGALGARRCSAPSVGRESARLPQPGRTPRCRATPTAASRLCRTGKSTG